MENKTRKIWLRAHLATVCRTIALAMVCLVGATDARAQHLRDKYSKENPLKVSCDIEFFPFEFRNDNGDPDGMNIDLISAALGDFGMKFTFSMHDKANADKAFEANETNLMLTPVVETIPGVYYGKFEVASYRVVLAQRKTARQLKSLRELRQNEVVVGKRGGYPIEKALSIGLLRHEQVQYRSVKLSLEGMANGEIDYFIGGEKTVKHIIERFNLGEQIAVTPIDVPAGKLRFVSRDRQLIEALDDKCNRMEQNGTLHRLNEQWIEGKKETSNLPTVGLFLCFGILTTICVFLLINRIVNNRLKKTMQTIIDTNNIVRTALEMGGNYIICSDMKTKKVRNLYGNLVKGQETDMYGFYDLIHPEDMERIKASFANLIKAEGNFEPVKYRLNHGTSIKPEWHVYMGQMAAETNVRGELVNVFTTLSDVTEEERQEQEERDTSETYKHIFEMSITGIALYSPEGKLVSANKMMRKIFDSGKFSLSTIDDTSFFDLPAVRGFYAKNEVKNYFVCTRCDLNGSGKIDYIDFRCRPVKDDQGKLLYYMLTARDMSDERQMYQQSRLQDEQIRRANAETQKYESELKILLEESNMMVWKSNVAKNSLAIYKDLRTFEKRTSLEGFIDLVINEEQKEELRRLIDPRLNGGETCTMTVQLSRSLKGEDKNTWYSINSVPDYDSKGNVKGCFGLIRDIDDLISIQTKMKEETERANDSGRLKSVFLANMTHEIRTPLNAIVGFCDVLQSVDAPEERAEFLKIILNNCDLLMQLINDILVISELDSNGLVLRPAQVDFADSFNMICTSLRQRVQEPSVELIVENPYDKLEVVMDVTRIQQVITNFLTNAVKYTHNGHIKLGYRCQDEGLYIYCEDTGAGIPADKCDKIFGRFVKLNDYIQGAGLGLSICKAIAEKCGGRIGVESEVGKGSTFWIWIPVKEVRSEE